MFFNSLNMIRIHLLYILRLEYILVLLTLLFISLNFSSVSGFW